VDLKAKIKSAFLRFFICVTNMNRSEKVDSFRTCPISQQITRNLMVLFDTSSKKSQQ